MMTKIVLVFILCVATIFAEETFETVGVRVALKIYDDCSKSDGFAYCLKKKAVVFLDRFSRMDKLAVTDGVIIKRAYDKPKDDNNITEEQLENILPRSSDTKDAALNSMLLEKAANFVNSRTLEITVPKFSADVLGIGEGRKGGGGGGSGGGGKGGMKGMMGGMMMGIAAKMAAMIPVAIAGLFLLAGKALITAKIALLLSGIIAIKKLFASKQSGSSGGHGGGGGWQSSGHGGGGGGWQSGGGGWDKRSLNDPKSLVYQAYNPK